MFQHVYVCSQWYHGKMQRESNLKPFPLQHASASKHLVMVVLVPLTSEAVGVYTPFRYKPYPKRKWEDCLHYSCEFSHVVTCCHTCPFSRFNLVPRSAGRDTEAQVAVAAGERSMSRSSGKFWVWILDFHQLRVKYQCWVGWNLTLQSRTQGSESKPDNPCLGMYCLFLIRLTYDFELCCIRHVF